MSRKRKSTATSSFGSLGRENHDAASFCTSKLYQELTVQPPDLDEEVALAPGQTDPQYVALAEKRIQTFRGDSNGETSYCGGG